LNKETRCSSRDASSLRWGLETTQFKTTPIKLNKNQPTDYESKFEAAAVSGVLRRVELDGGDFERVRQQDVARGLHAVAEGVRQQASLGRRDGQPVVGTAHSRTAVALERRIAISYVQI